MKIVNQNILNKILAILFIALLVIIIFPFSGQTISIMVSIVFAGMIFTIVLYTVKPGNLKIIYILLSVLFIKSLTVLVINKEAVLRSADCPGWLGIFIQSASLQHNPVLWFYISALMFFIYYILFRYHIMPRSELIARFSIDAMPGMQMSIDSDLANEKISIEEAKIKRADIRMNTDMAGAYHGLINLLLYEGLAMTFLFVISAVAVILREYYLTSHFFNVQGSVNLITISVVIILSLIVNTTLALIIPAVIMAVE